jgi:hypothetical protein
MRRISIRIVIGLAAALTVASAAQAQAQAQSSDGRERARAALPPEVFQQVDQMAAGAAQSGLPVEPIWDKVLEGAAKRVPPARIAPAVSEYVTRLSAAQGALGVGQPTDVLVAAADALRRGVPATALTQLGEPRARTPMALVVLADLVETGVPVDRALDVVREALARRSGDDEMLALNARVRAAMRQGESAAAAADRVRRTIRDARPNPAPTRDRAGPPAPPGSQPTTRDPGTGTTRPRGG